MPETPSNDKTNIHFLKPGQVEAMRDAAYVGRHGDRDDAIVTLLYDTGLRRGELAAVDREMVDLDEGELRLPGGIQKHPPTGGTPDPVTFELDRAGTLRTVRTLRAYLDGADIDDGLFPSRKSDRMTGKGINDVVKRLAARAEVRPYHAAGRGDPDDVTAHTLRHSVAWRMLRAEEGNTIYDVRNRLRHSTVATTEQRYDHFQTV
jgi:integrase